MARVAVVTDSTADLPAELRQALGIRVVPLNVHFGDEVFKDGVEMTPEGFWEKLRQSPHHPRTSQPAPGDFLTVYRELEAAGHPICSIHISAEMSGTLQSAQVAAEMLGSPGGIEVVDSRSVSMGLGLVVLAAARAAQRGASLPEVAAEARAVAGRLQILFGVDTLEFLQRNGRIGRAQALVGGLLNIKPVLQVEDGVVAAADKVRGRSRVLPRCLEIMAERIPPGRKVAAAVLYTTDPGEGKAWLEAFQKQYQMVERYLVPLGPVVACHAGPGTVGIAMYEVTG